MDENQKIREAIRAIIASKGITMVSLSKDAGISYSGLAQFLSGDAKNASISFLSKVCAALGVKFSELLIENDETPTQESPPAPKPAKAIGRESHSQQQIAQIITDTSKLVSEQADMPVYASAQGGGDGIILDMAQIVEWVKTPAPLFGVKGAFGMYVIGDSMEPVYDQGDMLLIHPHKPVYKNDDVIVSMTSPDGGESRVLIKRLVKMTSDEIKLYQFNPAKEFAIPRSEVSTVNLVVGKYRRR